MRVLLSTVLKLLEIVFIDLPHAILMHVDTWINFRQYVKERKASRKYQEKLDHQLQQWRERVAALDSPPAAAGYHEQKPRPGPYEAFIDPTTGEILHRTSSTRNCSAPGGLKKNHVNHNGN